MESDREAGRLEAKTDAKLVRQRLQLAQVKPGMRVLDAGAGSGAVSRVMCDMVTPRGEVVAVDQSMRRAAFTAARATEEGINNLRVVAGDLYRSPFPAQSFDMVWCEFVFEYLRDPDSAISELASLLRPGGKLVVADLDGQGLFHYPLPPDIERGLEALAAVLRPHLDPFAGRKLFHRFRKAGLRRVKVHMLPYHFYEGVVSLADREHWRLKFDVLRPVAASALGRDQDYDQWVSRYLEMLDDPDTFTYSVLFVVEGAAE